MADYHMLNDGVFGVAGGDIMDDTSNLVNAVSYSHAGPVNAASQGMMSQSIPGASAQNPNVMMQGMVPMQQAQSGAQLSAGGMTSYHQGAMHGYAQSEVPQKLHQYSVYGSQLQQAGNMGGQYVGGGPRLHHLSDPLGSSVPEQQASPRTVVPNQLSYQSRNMSSGHYGQQLTHPNAASAQMTQGPAQYQSHYGSIPHHSLQQQQQHNVQQMNQSADLWQNSMTHSQMTRHSMPASQAYSQHQMVPNQHGNTSLNHSPLTMQGQRPSTPNQGQYITNQEYTVQHAPTQQPMQRPPAYSMNSTAVNQNGSLVGQMSGASQSNLSQPHSSLSQTEQTMTFPQGHYAASSQTAANRPHYSTASAVGSTVGSHASQQQQQHVMGQQLMGIKPSVHQMGYSQPSARVNSGPQQQHAGSVPPGSPARLQQYHPPFSPNQAYSAQPSPRPTNPETATPPHLQHYANSQPHVQAPMSPQYRSPFPSQVTHSPQHLTPTPPAEVSVPPPHTPERVLQQSSTPQSQGSYHSPSTVHLTSPVQGHHSPGNTNAPSSLQHLEQMVLPRMSSGPSTTPTASNVSPGLPNPININHSSGVGASYYGHLPNTQQHPQQHIQHLSPAGEARPQPQSPVFTHVSQTHPQHHVGYLNQQQSVTQQPVPSVSSVPNSQPLPPTASSIQTLSSSNTINDDAPSLEPVQQHSSMVYSNDSSMHSNSSIPGANGLDSNIPPPTITPSVNTLGSVPSSAPTNQIPCTPSASVDSVSTSPHPYMIGKAPYQGSSSSVTYEMQQIQQELQQLYGMHQSPELHDKIKTLQDRLRYLQGQQNTPINASATLPHNANKPAMAPHYPRQTIYNSGKPASYTAHQPLFEPHTVHYKPQAQQSSPMQEVAMPSSHLDPMMNSLLPVGDISSGGVAEQDTMDTGNMTPANHYPLLTNESMPPLTAMEGPEVAPDPYELNFNDEPPPKLKRRAPKGEPKPKKPKAPKVPKSPKPKKPKKGKSAPVEGILPPNVELPPLGENMELPVEVGVPMPVEEELLPGILPVEATPQKAPKKEKSKKRKPKTPDEPGAEPKEPKPKKPRKRTPKQPKQPKETEAATEPPNNDGNNNSIATEAGIEENKEEPEKLPSEKSESDKDGKENVDAATKETKEKKSKSKSPKTPKDGTPKEPKKSSPKKKLPKIALRFTSKKKKKKILAVSENSDMEKTPPPSPKDDGNQKRRSARNTERKKYTDDIELHFSDDTIEMDFGQTVRNDGKIVQVVMDNHTEDYMVVEKILAVRNVKKQPESNALSDAENSANEEIDVEEYYVKYKNLSYIHCEWKTLEELEKGDRRFIQKVKRFKLKKETFNFFDFLEDDPFNPDYTEVDRVLDVNEIKEPIPGEKGLDEEIAPEDPKPPDEVEESEIKEKPAVSAEDETKQTIESVKVEHEESVKLPCEEDIVKTEESVKIEVEEPIKPAALVKAKDEYDFDEDSEDIPNFKHTSEMNSSKNSLEASRTSFKSSSTVIPDQSKDVCKKESSDKEDADKPEESSSCPEEVKNEESDDKETVVKAEGEKEAVIEEESKAVKITRHYLVKWRALTYEESTWELEDDVDIDKIEQFERFRHPPPQEKWKNKKRPKPSEWSQIPDSPVYKGGNTLREYQLEGVNWLTFCWYNSQNCILADEMGLGKTIQSLTFLNEIDQYGIPGPFLVIAPLSTIGNWQREFETWTDLNAITYHGSSPSRNMILEYEMYWKDEKGERILDVYKFQVMITTFEIILTDCMELKSIPWRCVIIDEAHRLKNRNCKLLEGLRMLNTEHRVLLTGTPLQNNVEELFSLLNFLEPSRFASTEAFLEEFGNLKTESQVDKLKALLKPMMLRRLKEDVEKSLAPKEETVVEVELTNIQKKYYRAILERNFTFLTKGNCYSNIPNLMNTMMELRKCCIHPFLINGAEEQIINDYKTQHEETIEANLNAMIQASGKLVLMDKLLPRLRTGGHRVLVFSQMVRCLDILEDYMVQKRYPYERIDGRVRGNLRQAAIDRFCKPDSDRFVFLLCTRAGGLGINLTAADTVIIFDSDWNPQNDLQAQARCHRIGQSKAVKVYRLICKNTYEREMFDKASLKLGLDKAVLQSMSMKENVGMNQQMSKKEIEDLLRKGAYGALMEDDNAGDKFCEEDIDQILQRRTQVIQLESGTKGSTFSKATFASASTRSDIEINDPNFWEKWAKKANLDVDELKNRNELIIQEPRRRTQTRRFGTDDLIDLSELESSDEDDDSVSKRTRASRKSGQKSYCPKSRGRSREDEFLEDIAPGNWTRAECYKVEKGLLTFGWGRWDECIALGQFRRRLCHNDCEDISRTILLYCLLHYKGDEKIKSFIWDLISPTYDGEQRIHKNHSGLSAPVPRGRKGKKIKKETKLVNQMIEECEWTKEEKYNPEFLLNDDIYKRHLNRHANKVLLRVRLLYYLKHEIIGDLHHQVFSGAPANMIDLFVPPCEGDPPAPWWDSEVDKSLLLGIYKLGFERYNLMRQDPTLCFLSRCGPPDGAALLAELNVISNEDDLEDQSQKDIGDKDKDVDDLEPLSPSSENDPPPRNTSSTCHQTHMSSENALLLGYGLGPIQFPSVTDINTRVRRLITAFQRNNKKLEIRNAQKARKIERREKFEAAIRERELKKRELQQRKWSRREEADFYRTISSFGVEFLDKEKKEYNWARFRGIARLERKFDETLAEYYKCFFAMCKRVCGRKLSEEDEQLSLNVDPISEERASRCLQRVELLSKIREEILIHPELDERLKLCQPSMDLPDWWICGKHDKDLLIGAAKHGLSRMDYHLLHDPNLSFKDVLKNIPNVKSLPLGGIISSSIGCPSPINIYHSNDDVSIKEEGIVNKLKDEYIENLNKDDVSVKTEEEKKPDVLVKQDDVTESKADIVLKEDTPMEIDTESEFEKQFGDNELKICEDENELKKVKEENSVETFQCDIKPEEEIEKMDVSLVDQNLELKIEELEKDGEIDNVSDKEHLESKVDISMEEKMEQEETETNCEEDSSIKLAELNASKNDEARNENEAKIEDESKNEDEETDIEIDLRKEEDQKDAVESISSNLEDSLKMGPPATEEVDKEDQKYECETDTESKSTIATPPIIDESSVLKTDAIKKEDLEEEQSSSIQIKQEDVICEDDLKEKCNLAKAIIVKDDALHSHIDDSQGCISQNEDVMSQASFNLETEMGEPTVAQLLAFTNGNAVRWPKDKVLQIRLEHITQAVEKNEWPVIRHTFLPAFPPVVTTTTTTNTTSTTPVPHIPVIASPASHSQRASPAPSISSQGHSGEVTPHATPEHTPHREPLLPEMPTPTPTVEFNLLRKSPLQRLPITVPTPAPVPPIPPVSEPSKHRRRRRRRRFEIEAERGMFTSPHEKRQAKLRQLLSHNMQQQQHHHQQQLQHVHQFLANTSLRSKMWDEHMEEKAQLPTVPSPSPAVPTVSASIPPPAHQNSSPRISSSLPGTLDLRVKSSITPPTPFTPLPLPSKNKSPIEMPGSGASGSPMSPMDLSAAGSASSYHHSVPSNPPPAKPKTKEKRGARGGSRIDALALNLQARKQQQLMQEQHHPLAELGSLLAEKGGGKEMSEPEEAPPMQRHHHTHHHSERRNVEEEETKLRKKRLQSSEDYVRKVLSRGSYDLAPTTAHSSFINPNLTSSTGRLNLGSNKSDDHMSANNPMLDHSSLMHHDFKKWLDDHPELVAANPNLVAAAAAAMAFSPVSSFPSHTELLELPEGRRRGRRPRLDPTKLDYEKITGEENVSVINRLTGKKITGSKAPPLKYLAEWLDKNPMFDVDPKWGPLVREKGNLPNNMNKRIVTPSEKRGRRTAASLLASAHQNLVPPVTTMSFPSSPSLNPLSFANTSMLTGFPNMKFFMDPPKSNAASTTTTSATATTSANPPIFLPFGGLAGMGLPNPLFGFPGFNFPGLQGTSLASPNMSSSSKDHGKDMDKGSGRGDKESGGSRKSHGSSSNATPVSLPTTMPSASSLPFLYPPGLLYNPLSLGGFTLPPNLPASFGSFSQSGLVNGLGLNSPLFTTSSLNTSQSSSVSSAAATIASSAAHSILAASMPTISSRAHPSHNTASSKLMMHGNFSENQETDDESLKSLMGNHDDDEDDLDDGKMEAYDNLDKDDSDRDNFRDAVLRKSPGSHIAVAHMSKNSASDSESLNLAKTLSEKYSVEILSKSRGIHDDPTSDSTDTESKHS